MVWLATGSLAASLAAIGTGWLLGAGSLAGPVFGGMIGPLVAAAATWVVAARQQARDPAGVMRVLVAAFAAKVLFFVAYVVAMIRIFDVEPRAFGLSFVASVIGLYAVQAAMFARLFRTPAPEAR
jgi:hypothetical protein